jgi:hypothetical protein
MVGAILLLFLRAFMVVTGNYLLLAFRAKYVDSHFVTREVG